MRFATLISWLLTASLGAFMLRTWLARGGLGRERARIGGLAPQLIFCPAGPALSGLLVWSGYVATGTKAVAWTAVGLLMVTIALGLCTVTLWTPYPARRPGEWRGPARADEARRVMPPKPRQGRRRRLAGPDRFADHGRDDRAAARGPPRPGPAPSDQAESRGAGPDRARFRCDRHVRARRDGRDHVNYTGSRPVGNGRRVRVSPVRSRSWFQKLLNVSTPRRRGRSPCRRRRTA